jgi:ribosome assembly protein 1
MDAAQKRKLACSLHGFPVLTTTSLTQDPIQHGTEEDPEFSSTQSAPLTARDFTDKIIHAFQLSTYQGPLCNEPVQGIAVFLESVTISNTAERQNLGRLTGEVIRAVRSAIHTGFLDWSPRIMLAMYICEIQASTEVLGRVYAVLTKRLGRVLSESVSPADLNLFTILATLPLATSFGFPTEILTRTSGYSSPQLRFSGFEKIDQDPFWTPQTEEELEDLGEVADRENVAKRFVDGVRRRKGLFVMGAARRAEGQKTLKR